MAVPYKVTWLSSQDLNQHDLTKDVISLPLFTDTGSGEVNSAVLILSSNGGKYRTIGIPIQHRDIIQIQDNDDFGGQYTRNFQVKKIIPSESKQTGNRLELHMLGLEYNSQIINFGKLFFASDAFSVCKAIQKQYNASKTNYQAGMKGLDDTNFNAVPNWNLNSYDFGANEEKCYNRLLEVIDKQGMPADAGGAFDYFDIGTAQDTQLLNQFTFKITSSGKHDSLAVIDATTSGTAVNTGETEGGIDDFKGSVLNAWGESTSGSLPMGYAKFRGGQLTYNAFPAWLSSTSYPVDANVTRFGDLYESEVANNTNNDPALDFAHIYWQKVTKGQYYGDAYVYSEWTKGRIGDLINCGSQLTGTNIGRNSDIGRGFFDLNIIKNDDSTKQAYADIKTTDPSLIPTTFQYPAAGNPNRFYQGFRVLCNGTGTGGFLNNDSDGNSFSNAIVEYGGDNRGWFVRYPAADNLRCAIKYEGKVYIFNNSFFGNGWKDMTVSNGSGYHDQNTLDCFHPYDSIIQDDIDTIDPTFGKNLKSAIKTTWTFDSTLLFDTDVLANGGHTAEWYKFGAWFSLVIPYPPNIITQAEGGNSTTVGANYGSSPIIKGPSLLDIQNMSVAPDGSEGFTTSAAENLGPLSSFDFRIKIKATFNLDFAHGHPIGGDQISGEANFKIGVAMFDINDNVAVQYGICAFNNNTADMRFPLSQFVIYAGRTPLNGLLDQVIPPVGLSPVNSFEWRHVKQICIFTAESYDAEGRYSPFAGRFGRPFNTLLGLPALSTYHKIEMWIDAIRFSKPLLANSDTFGVQGVNIEPEFSHHEEIETYQQLKGTVKEEYQRMTFPHEEYDLITTIKHDIIFSDTFYYYNPRVVKNPIQTDGTTHGDLVSPNANMPAGATTTTVNGIVYFDNTVKLVAKRIEFSRTKPSNGQGGGLRRILGVRRYGLSG